MISTEDSRREREQKPNRSPGSRNSTIWRWPSAVCTYSQATPLSSRYHASATSPALYSVPVAAVSVLVARVSRVSGNRPVDTSAELAAWDRRVDATACKVALPEPVGACTILVARAQLYPSFV